MTRHIAVVIVALFFAAACEKRDAPEGGGLKLVTIGAGAVTGVYFPTAGAIAKIVTEGKESHRVHVTVESTGGSAYNVNAMSGQDLDMGLVQSDVGHMAYNGVGDFAGRPVTKLRSVFSLHPEPFHIVARKDRGIASFADLKGKKINVGNPGSGQRLTAEELFAVAALGMDDIDVGGLKASEAPDYLRDGRIDAYFYTVGVGAANIVDVANAVDVAIIPVPDGVVAKLREGRPYYVSAAIPGGVYPGNDDPVKTFAVKATLLATADTSEAVVYNVVRSVFENFDRFRATHPALAELTHESMLEGLSAPFHPGAAQYYRERGWIE